MKPRSTTSEEPGISVSVAATRPPVQDSAVAMVSFFARQRSSSARACARSSSSAISVAPNNLGRSVDPWQANGRVREGRDALAAPGEAQFLAGRRLDRYAGFRNARDLGNARPHGVAMRTDARCLAHDRGIEMSDAAAARLHAP